MKRPVIYYLFAMLILSGCFGDNLPKGVLPKQKMAEVLVDIHLSEAINNQKYNLSMTRDSLSEDLYLSICRKHKIERSVVEASLLFYGKHSREYIPVYEEVLNILSEMEVKAKSDTLQPNRIGGFDLDTSKVGKERNGAVPK